MKKFQWRLQKVLEVNQKKQDAKKTELFKISEQLVVTKASLITQKRILKNEIEKVAKDNSAQKFAQQQLLLQSCKKNDEIIKKLNRQVQELQKLKDKATQEYIELKKFTEGLEKLREKAKNEYIWKQEKLQQKLADEQTNARFARAVLKKNTG
jgi:flagellar FliJ protein